MCLEVHGLALHRHHARFAILRQVANIPDSVQGRHAYPLNEGMCTLRMFGLIPLHKSNRDRFSYAQTLILVNLLLVKFFGFLIVTWRHQGVER